MNRFLRTGVMGVFFMAVASAQGQTGVAQSVEKNADASTRSSGQVASKETRAQFIERVFNQVDENHMHLLEEFYAPEVNFQDPISTHKGLEEIRAYYVKMYKNVKSISFMPKRHVEEGASHVMEWHMVVKTKSDSTVEADGISIFRFAEEGPHKGKVIYHRDYFDMGQFIYERIPVVGSLVRIIKNHFK